MWSSFSSDYWRSLFTIGFVHVHLTERMIQGDQCLCDFHSFTTVKTWSSLGDCSRLYLMNGHLNSKLFLFLYFEVDIVLHNPSKFIQQCAHRGCRNISLRIQLSFPYSKTIVEWEWNLLKASLLSLSPVNMDWVLFSSLCYYLQENWQSQMFTLIRRLNGDELNGVLLRGYQRPVSPLPRLLFSNEDAIFIILWE